MNDIELLITARPGVGDLDAVTKARLFATIIDQHPSVDTQRDRRLLVDGRRSVLIAAAACVVAGGITVGVLYDSGNDTPQRITPAASPYTANSTSSVLDSVVTPPVNTVGSFPWVDRPAQPNQRLQFAITLPSDQPSAPPCPLAALTIVPSADGAMGALYGQLDVHNIGDTVCQVQGVPELDLLDDQGRIVQSTNPASLKSNALAVVLVPNSWARAGLGIIGSNTCGGNQSSQLRVHWWDGDRTMPFEVSRPLDTTSCSGATERPAPSGLQPTDSPGGVVFSPIAGKSIQDTGIGRLTVTIEAPATVNAGTVLQYRVLITNSGENGAIIYDGACPIYVASLGDVRSQMFLNCDSAGIQLNSGATVSYDMHLTVPATAPIGASTLSWAIVEPAGPIANTSINIIR